MPVYKDQLHNEIFLSSAPKRIVSLVPSQTELLADLGLEEEVAGITKFCVHPQQWLKTKTRVGGTKNVNIEKIKVLQPDLIIANKEENVKEQIEELKNIAPVWISDVSNLDDALAMIQALGIITDTEHRAISLITRITTKFKELPQLQTTNHKLQTAYLIWRDPYMTVGCDTFINDMIKRCGLINVFENEVRYPETSLHQLSTNNCKLILLSSEPFPFKEKHAEEIKQQLPGTKVMLVDGEMFSWYGSRLLYAPRYFQQLVEKIQKRTKTDSLL